MSKGGFNVCWLHRSQVFHRASYTDTVYYYGDDTSDRAVKTPCGVTVVSPRVRCQEGTEWFAKHRLGLRRCVKCFDAS